MHQELVSQDQDRNLVDLGIMLKERRKSLGLSLSAIARSAYISPSYMGRIENGKTDGRTGKLSCPGIGLLRSWARAVDWTDDTHIDPLLEKAGYLDDQRSRPTSGRFSDPEQDALIRQIDQIRGMRGILLMTASSPEMTTQVRGFLEPYLEYVRFRLNSLQTDDRGSTRFQSTSTLPEVLTITEAAEVLRVRPLTLKRWEKKGKLVPVRINSRGDRRYNKAEVLDFISGKDLPQQEI